MCANGTPVCFDISSNNDVIVFHSKRWKKLLPCLCIANTVYIVFWSRLLVQFEQFVEIESKSYSSNPFELPEHWGALTSFPTNLF